MRLLALIALSLLSGCGYQSGSGSIADSYKTICIPFVKGDIEGHLTAELIKELTTSTNLCYQQNGGELALEVEVVEVKEENIGYRFERTIGTDLPTNRIVPTEERLTAVANICLKDTCNDCIVLGPIRVAAHVDYDHDYYTNITGTPQFSLGQLEDIGVARDVAQMPLDRRLAKRIVEYIASGCIDP